MTAQSTTPDLEKQEIDKHCICCDKVQLHETYILLKLRWNVCQHCRRATTEHVPFHNGHT